jgi:murein DD-endopeptidase MepM/ murein hydrolase activator NlpD
MSTFPSKDSDADPAVPVQGAAADITLAHQRFGAGLVQQSVAALNQAPPQALFDPVTKRHYFVAAPVPLKQLFGPPLVPKGTNARGGKRRASQGWGAARAVNYPTPSGGALDMSRIHRGLDFPAYKVDEPVIASADGYVTFIGVQLRNKPRLELSSPSVLANGNVSGFVDGEQVEVPANEIGHGGLYIAITHDGDFQNYVTMYMHLNSVATTLHARVLQGQTIGGAGLTGVINSTVHVHWQVLYHDALIKPEELVDFYMAGYDRDAKARQWTVNIGDPNSSNGEDLVMKACANTIQSTERCNNAENQSRVDHQKGQANFYAAIGAKFNADAARSVKALAMFEQALPVVEDALAFDYTTGLWSDAEGVKPKAGEGF